MTRRADGRTAGRAYTWIGIVAVVLAVGPSGRPAAAQVGHDPANTPYRDMIVGSGPVVFGGYLGGDRGRAGAGPSNALTFGARYELPTGRSLVLQISAAYMQGDRFIIDPAADSTDPARRTGPTDANLVHVEVGMHLRLTGAKTWRGLAPYLGIGLGMAVDAGSPGDTTASGYAFRSKLTGSTAAGLRWQPSPRMTVHGELKMLFWRLRYPVSFHSAAPDGSRVVPLADALTDWTIHPWISVGAGWTF